MTPFEHELVTCLEEILSAPVPAPELDAIPFYGQWLAERNLGLVPIANAASFQWAGRWLARVRAADGDHAVVMFGSPPGPLLDTTGAIEAGGTVVEGWLVAPLDHRLPVDRPYGADARVGSVAGVLVAPDAEAPLAQVDTTVALAGHGLAGDRYAASPGARTSTLSPRSGNRRLPSKVL